MAAQSFIKQKPAQLHYAGVQNSKYVIPNIQTASPFLKTHSGLLSSVDPNEFICQQFDKLTLGENVERLMAVFWLAAPGPCCFQSGTHLREVLSYLVFFFLRQLGGDWWSLVAQRECWRQQEWILESFLRRQPVTWTALGYFHTLSSLSSTGACWQAPHILSAPDT